MGIVTDHLVKLIQRQVEDKRLVLWCDPDCTYAALAANLTLPDTRLARFAGSYLALRREIDEALNDVGADSPPRLVVYHPAPLAAADHALDELVTGGIVMQPGGQSLPLNTNLEVVARHALKLILPADKVDGLCEQIRKGQIVSLDELDELASKTEEIGAGALALIFGAGQPTDIALHFAATASHDDALLAKAAGPQLAALLNAAFGASMPLNEKPDELRARFRKHLLLTEFRASLTGEPPAALATVPYPPSPAREACTALVRAWRNRRDLQSAYAEAARRVQTDYGINTAKLHWVALRNCETFPSVEACLQNGVEEALLTQPTADLIQLANTRQNRFWAETEPLARGRWTLLATAGRILLAASRILETLQKTPPTTAADYIERYTAGPEPWCQLDTDHRALERLALNFDLDIDGTHASLEKLLVRARQHYSLAVDALAQKFVKALADEAFAPAGALHQTEIFTRHVAPVMASGKTAYILVDALRYEMARDLAASLNPNWRVELSPAIATAPTITPIGMAALLPGAERGLSLVDAGQGKLAAEVNGRILKDRKERVAYLESQLPGFVDLKLEDLVPMRKATREKLRPVETRFILITSQEIDLLGEGDSSTQAREFMDSALGKLARAFRVLADVGVQNIIVAADHGYLFAEELDSDRTFPAPGGRTVDLHRRVWVGKGGQELEGVLRVPVQALNLGGDYELATPYGLACFAAPSGRTYFHGGLSLQELLIPVLIIQPTPAPVTAQIEWSLQPVSAKLTTRFFSAIVGGQSVGIFDVAKPRIRVEIQAHNKTISTPVSATYGLSAATGEVEMRPRAEAPDQLEPNTITMRLTGDVETKTVTLVLVDVQTERHPKEVEIESAIAL